MIHLEKNIEKNIEKKYSLKNVGNGLFRDIFGIFEKIVLILNFIFIYFMEYLWYHNDS